ncbi:assembly of actin patch protein [Coniosporium tulheliwenetii]|uniref:Assembly of actin patch protein n=1 Tax=Coniosporium tulheliwenetii TaxID=3383036 RepID=A0ACC2YL30_9PEZI|nr:assembly of actin patch protein [Cladosporium sp. JES 115]
MARPPFKVKAIYNYDSPHEDDLSFPEGQIITVTEEEDADWYVGEYTDSSGAKQHGLFPKNFVERYEPAPPPRPARTARPKQPEPAAAPVGEETERAPPQPAAQVDETDQERPKPDPPSAEAPTVAKPQGLPSSPPPVSVSKTSEPKPEPPPASEPAPAPTAGKAPPPAVAEKPSSFRDRIAAFNKPAAAPIAPFKPTGAPGGFIKKPFVAPPPSRDAYVPPPREPVPQKVYRREEDPEIAQRQEQDQEDAEKAGLASTEAGSEDAEAAPKPQSLKERIALLQKQQMEAAARHAEAGNKEKPKRPPKKRTESYEPVQAHEAEGSDTESLNTTEQISRKSTDLARDAGHAPPVRRQSRGPRSPAAVPHDRELFSDGNDADQSAAGETTEEAEGSSTSVEDDDGKSKLPRAPGAFPREPDVGDEEATVEDDEEEEDDMDAETRRRMELRERMAKMSGGMGMAGMFGPPGGMPLPGAPAPKRKKPAVNTTGMATEEPEASSTQSPPQRMPMIPIPGMPHREHVKSPDSDTELAVEKEPEPTLPITSQRQPDEVPDVEDIKPEVPPLRQPEERAVPPPPPSQGVYRSIRRKPVRRKPLPYLAPFKPGICATSKPQVDGTGAAIAISRVKVYKRPVQAPPLATERAVPPPIPSDRPVPTPPQARPVPPPPTAPRSPTPGSESDDDLPGSTTELPVRGPAPAVPSARNSQLLQDADDTQSTQSPTKRTSFLAFDPASSSSPTMSSPTEKRSSRIPPIPVASPDLAPAAYPRPPPPPPPTAAPPSRQPTMESVPRRMSTEGDEGETEYEGDYDTDIAPGATHKDALKSHARESSLDDSVTADDRSFRSPPMPPSGFAPPVPPAAAPRAVPPPLRSNHLKTEEQAAQPGEYEYDPYKYSSPTTRDPPPAPGMPPSAPAPVPESQEYSDDDEDLYSAPPPRQSVDRPPPLPPQAPPQRGRPVPPPPVQTLATPQLPPPGPPTLTHAPVNRKSLDVDRQLANAGRRSMDQPRPSAEHEHPAPVLQNRPDILFEVEETTNTKRGGKTTISKDVYVLYPDYSQTVITARFDPRDVGDVVLEQRHEPPPARLRQDQLEAAHARFGQRISDGANSKHNTVVGDGSPQALVLELIRSLPSALLPIGTRAYGALVYANIANASVQQIDEIRPGDIITFRNAKFQGKHGPVHTKYSVDVGKPDHVGVVVDWDGTKKKVRAWEQGRENKKVKMESFKVGDLKSGEVRVWRVMGRSWVGWEDDN